MGCILISFCAFEISRLNSLSIRHLLNIHNLIGCVHLIVHCATFTAPWKLENFRYAASTLLYNVWALIQLLVGSWCWRSELVPHAVARHCWVALVVSKDWLFRNDWWIISVVVSLLAWWKIIKLSGSVSVAEGVLKGYVVLVLNVQLWLYSFDCLRDILICKILFIVMMLTELLLSLCLQLIWVVLV